MNFIYELSVDIYMYMYITPWIMHLCRFVLLKKKS